MFYILYTLSIAVFGFSAAEKVPLPPITICKRDSVNFSNCLKTAIQKAWPQFVEGLPEFDSPPLDPIIYEFGTATFDSGPIHGKVNVSNFNLEGFGKIRFLGARSNLADNFFRLEIDIYMPKLEGAGECDAVGTLGPFRMGGKGHVNLTADDIQGTWILTGPVTNDIWTVERFHATPSVKKMKMYFEDLFDGSKELNDLAMFFVNEYWPTLYRVMAPTAGNTWSPWLCDLANHFFSKVSFKQIFPS